MRTRLAAILGVLVTFLAVVLYAATQANTTASATGPAKTETGPVKTVTICHATGSQSHPYVELGNVPGFQFVFGIGHGGHTYDIWPSFQYKLRNGHVVTVPSHGDQSILRNKCKVPGEDPTVSPCPTVTVTVTASPDAKTHPTPTQCPTVTTTATATSTVTTTATATATVTGPTSTVTITSPPGPFVPSTGCPPPNLFNAIRGNHRANTLVGTPCRDVMAGHGNNDSMFGAAETDIMIGGRGNDSLNGGTERDILRGGFGDDRINANDGQPGDRIVGGVGFDRCIINAGDTARQCERVITR